MGCDIHLHSEVKIGRMWHHYAEIRMGRNYEAFTFLAGVRECENVPNRISDPRGLPTYLSVVTQAEVNAFGEDGHSHSWISAEEIRAFRAWWGVRFPRDRPEWDQWLCGNYYSDFLNRDAGTPYYDDVRFVFWFDN